MSCLLRHSDTHWLRTTRPVQHQRFSLLSWLGVESNVPYPLVEPHERLPEILVVPREKTPRMPQLEETPETPPSSRAEGLLFLHGLESNPGSSLQTEEEAGLP